MKKSIILLLCFVLMFSVFITGCSNDTEKNGADLVDSDEAGEIKGEITFSTWGSLEEKKVNEDIIKAFEAKYPGTKVNLEYIPDEYTTKVETMFLGGNPPDVVYGHPRYFTKWASQGLLMDLTDRFNENPELLDDSLYITSLYDAFTYDGKKIATVNGADTFLIFYNKDLFDEADVEYPNENWTWADLVEAAKKLTIIEDGKPKQFGISVGGWYPLVQTYMFSHGGKWYDDMNQPTEVLFNSPETVEALQLMQDLIFKHKVAPSSSDLEVLGGGFDNGKIAMDITGVWAIVYRMGIEDFEWDLADIPVPSVGMERKTSCLYAGYAIPKSTKNPELAWEFAKFMQSEEGQKLLASSGLITVINRKIAESDEVLKVEGAPENHYLRVSSLDYAEHNDALLTNWEETLAKVFDPNIQLLLNNEQDAKTTAEKIHQGLEEMLKAAK